MMKYLFLIMIIPLLSAGNCKDENRKHDAVNDPKKESRDSIPRCIQKLIVSGNKEVPETPIEVDEYLYNGKNVYLVTAPCCDQFNVVYDDSCRAICAPSGGFTGRGDGKCPDFEKNAMLVRLIWKKEK